MFNQHDLHRDEYMLTGSFKRKGYDWWWHSLTAEDAETGEEKPFFFECYIINPAKDPGYPVLGQLKENKEKGRKPSYVMVKCGTWGADHVQLHAFFSVSKAKIQRKAPYSVEVGENLFSETSLKGHVKVSKEESLDHPEMMSDYGELSWDLKLHKDLAFNVGYGAGKLFRDLKAFEMYWHAEGMKSEYEGTLIYNGRKYLVKPKTSYGYADKNWGRGFTSPWVWLASSSLTSKLSGKKLEHSAFDIGGGRPKVFCFALERKLLGVFDYEGDQSYEFNFAKFWMGIHTTFSFKESSEAVFWHVEQYNHHKKMVTDITCRKKDMLFVNYEDPNGDKRHNHLWNGGNGYGEVKIYKKGKKHTWILEDDIEAKNVGCEYGEYDTK